MSRIYDNWEILVEAVLRRKQLRQLALCPSMDSCSISSSSSFSYSFDSSPHIEESNNYEEILDKFLEAHDQHLIETPLSQVSQSSYLDPMNGKSCHMLCARELLISRGGNIRYWKWTSHAYSRFSEVAELIKVRKLDIRGRIRMRLLSPDTIYAAFLVFKLANTYIGLESADAIIKFTDVDSDRDAETRAVVVHLQQVEDRKGEIPMSRDDGWMEVELGKFHAERDNGEVEARLLDTKHWKSGLIVKCIEFRPMFTETPFVFRKPARRNLRQKGIIRSIKTRSSTDSSISYLGLLRVWVSGGIYLAVREGSIRPYVVLEIGNQKLKTRVLSKHSNPEWHQDLTFAIPDTVSWASLIVRSHNMYSIDDKIGDAVFDVKPMIKASAMKIDHLPNGTIITKVRPTISNCLAGESCVIWKNGELVQDLRLKLKNVKSGAMEIQLQWIYVPGCRLY